MSKRKKYIRVYVNGEKIQSTGSHLCDRKSVMSMWMLDNPEKNIKDILFGQLSGKCHINNQVVIEIEVMGYYDGEKEEKRKKAISEIANCLKSDGYSLEKIFIISNGVLTKSYTVKREEE